MLSFDNYYQDSETERRGWKLAKNTDGLYILVNPFALPSEQFEDLSQNLAPVPDHTYKASSGWSYRVKIRDDGKLDVIGWKPKPRPEGGYPQKGGYKKSYSGTGNAAIESKQYVDVEVKHTENISTVNEILGTGYMNGEQWRLQSIINMHELSEDGKSYVVPHFVLVRRKEFVPVAKTIASQNPLPASSTQQTSEGMPE